MEENNFSLTQACPQAGDGLTHRHDRKFILPGQLQVHRHYLIKQKLEAAQRDNM